MPRGLVARGFWLGLGALLGGCDMQSAGHSPGSAVAEERTAVAEGTTLEAPFVAEWKEAWTAGGEDDLGGLELSSRGTLRGSFGPDGRTLIVDGQGSTLFVLDAVGKVEVAVGARGRGPGEFQSLLQGGFLADSLVWGYDSSLRRFTWFDLQGRLLATSTYRPEQVPGTPFAVVPGDVLNGGYLLGTTLQGAPAWSEAPRPLVVFDPDGEMRVADWIVNTAPGRHSVTMPDGRTVSGPLLYSGDPLIRVASNREWVAVLYRGPDTRENGVMPIVRYAPSGRVMDTIRIAYQPVPLPDSAVERARRFAEGTARQAGVTVEELLAVTWLPSHLPPAQGFRPDGSGFWIQSYESFSAWRRYDLEGRLRGTAQVPPANFVLAADPTSILTWYPGPMGHIVRRFDLAVIPDPQDPGP